MTPEQALQIVSDALQPSMAGKVTRAGYVAIEEAIHTLSKIVQSTQKHDE
jgi:hypothetical protein